MINQAQAEYVVYMYVIVYAFVVVPQERNT